MGASYFPLLLICCFKSRQNNTVQKDLACLTDQRCPACPGVYRAELALWAQPADHPFKRNTV